MWHCATSTKGMMTCAHWDPSAHTGQAVFLTDPHPTQAWATAACWLTKQLLAVQLLPVEGAGPIEQSVVFGVHRLNLI